MVLSIGALLQLLLIAALPVVAMNSDEWRSFLSLFALLTVSIGSAIAPRRWGREAVVALTVGSVYAAFLIAWTAVVTYGELSTTSTRAKPTQILSLALALGTLATLPIALAFAWPLGRAAVGSDSPTDR